MSLSGPGITVKRVEFLKALAPHVTRIVVLAPSDLAVNRLHQQEADRVAPALGIKDVEFIDVGLAPEKWGEIFEWRSPPSLTW